MILIFGYLKGRREEWKGGNDNHFHRCQTTKTSAACEFLPSFPPRASKKKAILSGPTPRILFRRFNSFLKEKRKILLILEKTHT